MTASIALIFIFLGTTLAASCTVYFATSPHYCFVAAAAMLAAFYTNETYIRASSFIRPGASYAAVKVVPVIPASAILSSGCPFTALSLSIWAFMFACTLSRSSIASSVVGSNYISPSAFDRKESKIVLRTNSTSNYLPCNCLRTSTSIFSASTAALSCVNHALLTRYMLTITFFPISFFLSR